MAQFLELPRELRDQIYYALITSALPRSRLEDGAGWEERTAVTTTYRYRKELVPVNCATFLRCNRQVYAELSEAIQFAKEKDFAALTLECMIRDIGHTEFAWRKIPFVESTCTALDNERNGITSPSYFDTLQELFHKYMLTPPPEKLTRKTLLHQLWVDVKLAGEGLHWNSFNGHVLSRAKWHICLALRDIVENGSDFQSNSALTTTTTDVEEVVLNLVSDGSDKDDDLKIVAESLITLWNNVWLGRDPGTLYRILLYRVQRVRVCIGGRTYKVRNLRLELQRGHSEAGSVHT
ncbi:hypothetical protein M011DRAFT_339302 [Sporormia fimetaria CBS 119925]|uniref:F-box domain-containing protein n=1 Tax=Sporormia fimetaria CBS 119925 TaxID=1340428 RepID=A0A6A6VIB2_9PLEO|nr:hypothetical protein M011DRAFT_339302 [Sporormia fimetaria CBS 119925]